MDEKTRVMRRSRNIIRRNFARIIVVTERERFEDKGYLLIKKSINKENHEILKKAILENANRTARSVMLTILRNLVKYIKKEYREPKKRQIPPKEEPPKPKKSEEKQKNLNPIVRVTQDMPEFIGTNEKKYNLRKNDILSLPKDMHDMLCKRGAVKKINR